jgi:hypothetical protein
MSRSPVAGSHQGTTTVTKHICSVDGCSRPHHSHGYCKMHYQRVRYGGDPGEAGPRRIPGLTIEQRFWAKANRENGPVDPELGTRCWPWMASKDKDGYGQFQLDGRPVKAHRIAFALFVGELWDQFKYLQVDHRCHTPACVRPEHLDVGRNAIASPVFVGCHLGRMGSGWQHFNTTASASTLVYSIQPKRQKPRCSPEGLPGIRSSPGFPVTAS